MNLLNLLFVVIGLVLVFDFINGFHDSANSIATVVSTNVLTPLQAVAFAAFFNACAGLFFTTKVAAMIGKGIVDPQVINLSVIMAGLIGAIVWNLLTWWWGLPSSSSHTLVGGLTGAAIVKAGTGVVIFSGIFKILIFIIIAPVLGMALSFVISGIVINICRKMNPSIIDKYFRKLQLISAGAFSLGHGGNDAQKSMGIIWVALIVTYNDMKSFPARYQHVLIPHWLNYAFLHIDKIPSWAIISCYTAIGFGTLFGGWRIVKTMGQKITKLKPFEGFCAETAGALTLFGASSFGIPVSTTHTITGAIMGVGARKSVSAVKWGVARNILWAWILTIPISAAISALVFYIIKFYLPV